MTELLILHGRATSLVLEAQAGGAPIWRYWGPRLGDKPVIGPSLTDQAEFRGFLLDQPLRFDLLPGYGLGWFGRPALARGVGEQLTAVSVPVRWYAVIVPPVAVATATVFAGAELTRDTPSAKMDVFSEGYGRNDLQPVAVARFPAIAEALGGLRERSPQARMTGSGGCVYAPFASEAEAHAAFEARPPAQRGFVARSLAVHPLAGFA